MTQLKTKTSLKGYTSQLEKLKGEREVLLFNAKELVGKLDSVEERIVAIEKKIAHIKQKSLTVSEHAVLRYIERIEVISPSEVPDQILTPKLKEMVAVLGDGTYPMGSFKVKVRGNVVVTVLKNEQS